MVVLQELRDTKATEADAIVCSNPGVVEEHTRRSKKIKEDSAELEKRTAECDAMAAEITAVRDEWLPELLQVGHTPLRYMKTSFQYLDIGMMCQYRDKPCCSQCRSQQGHWLHLLHLICLPCVNNFHAKP